MARTRRVIVGHRAVRGARHRGCRLNGRAYWDVVPIRGSYCGGATDAMFEVELAELTEAPVPGWVARACPAPLGIRRYRHAR